MTLKTPSQAERQRESLHRDIEWSVLHYPMTSKINSQEFEREIVDPVAATLWLFRERFGREALDEYDMGKPHEKRVLGLLETRWKQQMSGGDD